MNGFNRITIDPQQMAGFPCVRHLPIPVADLVRLASRGRTDAEILACYPQLEPEDIRQALGFASSMQARQMHLHN